MIPVLSLLVDPLDQRVSGGIGMCVHGRAAGQARIRHLGHVSDGALAIATRYVVVVEVIMRHDELVRWECW